MGKIALFAGSFDPFTLGHDSIVRRTLEFTDQVVIGIGKNEGKHMMFTQSVSPVCSRKHFTGNRYCAKI